MWVRGMPQPYRRVWSESSAFNNAPLFNIGTEAGGTGQTVDIYVRGATNTVAVAHRQSTGVAFDGAWHHIAWVDEVGFAALYIDGARDATDFTYDRPEMDLDITTIGGILRAASCCLFTGDVDDVRAYTYALAEEEIQELAERAPPGVPILRGDSNGDTRVNIADAQYTLNRLFVGGPAHRCEAQADSNGDTRVNIADAQFTLNHLFLGGPPPPAPFPNCQFVGEEELAPSCEESTCVP
jgi:hypothetical protein